MKIRKAMRIAWASLAYFHPRRFAGRYRRKKLTLPDFERTFFAPVDCRNRSAIYVSAQTKCKVSAILHLLGNDNTRLTALADNMLRFVIGIYRDELNYLHEKKNNRQPF